MTKNTQGKYSFEREVKNIYGKAVKWGFSPIIIAILYAVFSDNKEAIMSVTFCVMYGILSALLYLPILLLSGYVVISDRKRRRVCVFFHLTILTVFIIASTFTYGLDYGLLMGWSILFFIDLCITIKTHNRVNKIAENLIKLDKQNATLYEYN